MQVALDGMDCFTMRNGLIVSNFVVYAQMSFAHQLGMLPEQGSVVDRAMIRAFNVKTLVKKRVAKRE